MFPSTLKILRKASGYKSQQAFADAFGVAQSTVGMWEAGKREPNYETTIRLSKFFNVSIDYLLGNEHKAIQNSEGMEVESTDGDKRTATKIPTAPWRREESAVEKFSRIILESAHEHGLCVRELEEACNRSILLCREASVPTLQSLQRDQEN